jgi:hypothetical protein
MVKKYLPVRRNNQGKLPERMTVGYARQQDLSGDLFQPTA